MSGQPPQARPPWRRKLLLALALLPVWCGVAELGYRVVQRVRGNPYDAASARAEVERTVGDLTQIVHRPDPDTELDEATREFFAVWHAQPYYGFEDEAQPTQIAHMTRRAADPAELRVLVLGGSVAWLMEPAGTQRLAELIEADPRCAGRRVVFDVQARPAFKQPQQVMQLAYLLQLGVRPDVVLSIDGFNEAAFGYSNVYAGVNPVYPDAGIFGHVVSHEPADRETIDLVIRLRAAQERGVVIGRMALRWGLMHSAVLAHGVRAMLWRAVREANLVRGEYSDRLLVRATGRELSGPPFAGGRAAEIASIVTNWREASLSMHAICESRGIAFVHVLQPTLFDSGSKPLTEEEIQAAGHNLFFENGSREVYPSLRAGGPALRERGIAFLDASLVFAEHPETLYYDHCHFGERGQRIFAEAIAPVVLAELAAGR